MFQARLLQARFALAGALLCVFAAAAPADEPKNQQEDEHRDEHRDEARGEARDGRKDSTVSIDKWPKVAQKAYREMTAKYGEPDGVTPTRLIWTNKEPFLEIILLAAAYDHQFPKPHKDCLEHLVAYDVPVEKVGELARFDGSIIVDRTRGVMSARCDSEPHNLMALNLADDIIRGRKSVEEARQAYAEAAKMQKQGEMPEIAKRLQFEPVPLAQAGDPDVAIIGPQAGDEAGDDAQTAGAEEPAADPADRPAQQERQETQDQPKPQE